MVCPKQLPQERFTQLSLLHPDIPHATCYIRWVPKRDDIGSAIWQHDQISDNTGVKRICPRCKEHVKTRMIDVCRRCHRHHVYCYCCGCLFCSYAPYCWKVPMDEGMSPACGSCPKVIERYKRGEGFTKEKERDRRFKLTICVTCMRYHVCCEGCRTYVCYSSQSEDTPWRFRIFFPFQCVGAVLHVPGVTEIGGSVRVHSTDTNFQGRQGDTKIQIGYAIASEQAFQFFSEPTNTPASFTFQDEHGDESIPFLPELLKIEYPEWKIEAEMHPRQAALVYECRLASAMLQEFAQYMYVKMGEALYVAAEHAQNHTVILRWARTVKDMIALIQRAASVLPWWTVNPHQVVTLTAAVISATLSLPNEAFNPILLKAMIRFREAVIWQEGCVRSRAVMFVQQICRAALMIHCSDSFNSYSHIVLKIQTLSFDENEDKTQVYTESYIDCRKSLHTLWKDLLCAQMTRSGFSTILVIPEDVNDAFDEFDQARAALETDDDMLNCHIVNLLDLLKMQPILSTARHIIPIVPGIHEWVVRDLPFDESFDQTNTPTLLNDQFWQVLVREDFIEQTPGVARGRSPCYSRTIPSYVSYEPEDRFILKHHGRAGNWRNVV